MRAVLAGVAYANGDRFLFQTPMNAGVMSTQQGLAQMPYAYTPAEAPQYVMMSPPVEYVEAYAEESSASWSWLAFAAAVGAGVGTIAQKVLTPSTSQSDATDLEAGMYDRRVAMLSVGAEPSEKTARILEDLKSMTLLEASELVKAIEETFGVDASAAAAAPMMMAAPGAAPAEAAAEEKTEFTVMLESFPADKKIAVLKVVRTATGLGLKEAKEMVEAAPKAIKEDMPKEAAEELKKQIEEAGGVVALK